MRPDTHVILLSYVAMPTDTTLADGVSSLSAGGVDFGNASIGFHAMHNCRPISEITTLVIPGEPPVAMLATELPPDSRRLARGNAAARGSNDRMDEFSLASIQLESRDFVTQSRRGRHHLVPGFRDAGRSTRPRAVADDAFVPRARRGRHARGDGLARARRRPPRNRANRPANGYA